ncbi:MAG: twin-arginine translocase subunit TatC [Candidatus Eisenbacteria bacterium]|nr:twin-arginine translocase subunit TatC [Candidatus Eisenbacteria bacterium]
MGIFSFRKKKTGEVEMPFLEHLEELRKAILLSIAAVAVFTIFGWVFSRELMNFLVRPIGKAVFLSPAEAFATRFKLSIIIGILVSLPYVSYKAWGFIVPGLLENERALLFPLVVLSTVLFLLGVLFGYLALVPIIVKVLIGFGGPSVTPMISVSNYLGFVMRLCLAAAILFQLPIVASTLTWFGILSPRFLMEKWRYAIVIIFILGAVLTPGGDVISQIAMVIPILILYGISIAFSGFVWARKRKTALAPNASQEGLR